MVLCGGVQSPRRRSREKAIILTVLLVVGIYVVFFGESREKVVGGIKGEAKRRAWGTWFPVPGSYYSPVTTSGPQQHPQNALVVASIKNDDTSWLFKHFPDWHKSIYVVDDPNAPLTVPLNKGRESMAYLT